jgi:thiol-disulfide isomerase/thioredoxin
MFSIKGLAAAFILAGLLSIPMYFYWEFLTKGMRPPHATQILNELEKTGVPDFGVKSLDGEEIRLSQFKGKIVLINFWATWCAPCVKEFPSLSGLVQKMDGKVVILAISYDKHREDIDTFVKAFGGVPKNFHIAWDPERLTSKQFGTDVLPETYIISGDGKLIRKIAGETTWDDPMALRFFENVFEGRMPVDQDGGGGAGGGGSSGGAPAGANDVRDTHPDTK